MVHALQQTHNLIRSGGWLVNVHDLPVPHLIELQSNDTAHKVGWILDKGGFESTRASLDALAQVVSDGLFFLEDERSFFYKIYAGDLAELQAWLAIWWESALLPERTAARLEDLALAAGEPYRILLSLQARMSKLRAV